jgi:hypothetical protein
MRCEGSPECVRKLEEEMATVYSRAALQRLAQKLPDALEEPCADSDHRFSGADFNTADFGATQRKYRLVLPVNTGPEALEFIGKTVRGIYEQKKETVPGLCLDISPGLQEPDRCIRIELGLPGGSTVIMAARFEHADQGVVRLQRKSGSDLLQGVLHKEERLSV